MGLKIKDYVKHKPATKVEMRTTSVTLERTHLEFVQRLNLNLSKIVRDVLQAMIEDRSVEDEVNRVKREGSNGND